MSGTMVMYRMCVMRYLLLEINLQFKKKQPVSNQLYTLYDAKHELTNIFKLTWKYIKCDCSVF